MDISLSQLPFLPMERYNLQIITPCILVKLHLDIDFPAINRMKKYPDMSTTLILASALLWSRVIICGTQQ